MASIFSLYGNIFVENEDANKKIEETTKKGKESSKTFAQSLGDTAKTVGKIGTAVVGATTAVVTGVGAMATKVADTAGAIDDGAKKAGVSAEEYQKWAYAAKLGGMEMASIEKAMIKQQKSFADAKDGSKAMSEAYQRLGIDIKNIGSSGDAFNQVIAKLADMEDETQRNALANDIFGKSYADLAPMLAEGSAGIEAMKQEAVDLGGVMSNEMVESGASFGDVIDRIKTGLGGAFNQLIGSLFPILQQVLQLIVENMPVIQGMISTLAPVLTGLLQAILPVFMDFVQMIFPLLMDLINQLLPPIAEIIKQLLPVFTELLAMILPPIIEIVKMLLPLLLSLIKPLLPLLQPILNLLQPFIDLLLMIIKPLTDILNLILPPLIGLFSKLIEGILPGLQGWLTIVAEVLGNVFAGAFENIKKVATNVINIFKNIIDFVKNVFTGNWKGAWENIKNIFSNYISGLGTMFKIPINYIIDIMNGFIKGINKIKIPDWVPGVGGKGINLQLIKRLKVGIDYVPYDEMPALLHKGEQVLTKEEAQEYRNSKNIVVQSNNLTKADIADAFKEAIKSFKGKVVLDDREVGKFVIDTMEGVIYG